MMILHSTNESRAAPLAPVLYPHGGELLWSRSLLQCLQFYQCPLKRNDPAGGEPGYRGLAVAVAPCIRDRVRRRRHRRRGFRAALLDEGAGVAENFREAALLAVQPTDLHLERTERNFERAAHKAA